MIGMLLASNYSRPGEPVFRPAQMGMDCSPVFLAAGSF
jgi:hypothetical protein